MLPLPFWRGLGLRGHQFRGHLCLHLRYGPRTRSRPEDGSVDRLQGFSFLPPCYPSY